MRIVITGASGFIGKLLYPDLIAAGMDVVVIGRDNGNLKAVFPQAQFFDYSQLDLAFENAAIVVHLAVINSDSKASEKVFKAVNVDLLMTVANAAQNADVKRFVNISSIHALQVKTNTRYANSKREGIVELNAKNWPSVENVYLPAFYGHSWAGKLSVLNKLPLSLAKIIFLPMAALKPTLNVKGLVDYILSPSAFQMHAEEKILFDDKDNNNFYLATKRVFDLFFVLFVGIFLWWLLLLVWIGVRLSSNGPGIFIQTRVGKKQKPFKCYKFRTMAVGTKNVGTHDVETSSVTAFGSFLRKTKFDELPQIVNIFRNELSLVGPRPCLPNQLELVNEREARGVFSVKPGITGLGQINNIDMSTPRKLAIWDRRYIATRGLVSDCKIMIATALGKGQGDRVKE